MLSYVDYFGIYPAIFFKKRKQNLKIYIFKQVNPSPPLFFF